MEEHDLPPMVFVDAVAKLRNILFTQGVEAVEVQVRYGEGCLEHLDPMVLRRLGRVRTLLGMTVVFPEEQGIAPRLVDVTLRGTGGGSRAHITPELLNDSR